MLRYLCTIVGSGSFFWHDGVLKPRELLTPYWQEVAPARPACDVSNSATLFTHAPPLQIIIDISRMGKKKWLHPLNISNYQWLVHEQGIKLIDSRWLNRMKNINTRRLRYVCMSSAVFVQAAVILIVLASSNFTYYILHAESPLVIFVTHFLGSDTLIDSLRRNCSLTSILSKRWFQRI